MMDPMAYVFAFAALVLFLWSQKERCEDRRQLKSEVRDLERRLYRLERDKK